MRRRILLWFVLWVAQQLLVQGFSVAASDIRPELQRQGHVRVRVGVEPARQVMLGQQTRFFVEILTDSWFTDAPVYPELILEGAIALMPEQLGSNFTERIDGVTFAAQRRSYVIFPQRAGPLTIPSLQVRLGVSEDGRAGPLLVLHTRSVHLHVVLPSGAEGVVGLVTTPAFRIREEWSRPLEALRVGDAVKRTVYMDADQSLGMLLPALAFHAHTGIAVYLDQPRIVDQINRGEYRGERVESVSYFLQRPGEFTLPEIELHWWNLASGKLVRETLKARTFEVAASVAGSAVITPAKRWESWSAEIDSVAKFIFEYRFPLLLAVFGAIATLLRARRILTALTNWQRTQRRTRGNSEPQLFQRLEQSAGRGDLDAVVRNYWRWRDHLAPSVPFSGQEVAQRIAETSGFAQQWRDLEHQRYAGAGSAPDADELRRGLRDFRRALLASRHARVPTSNSTALNPRGTGM